MREGEQIINENEYEGVCCHTCMEFRGQTAGVSSPLHHVGQFSLHHVGPGTGMQVLGLAVCSRVHPCLLSHLSGFQFSVFEYLAHVR